MPFTWRARNPAFAAGKHAVGHPAIALALLLALPLALPLAPAAQAQDDPYVQRGVPAEATAETAVVARDRALIAGQRAAYERLAAAAGLPRGASDATIEGMVRSIVIESERITARGYAARITVNFAGGARAASRPAEGASPAASAPSATVVPPSPGFGSTFGGTTVATVEAAVRYRSFLEYVEINRRLSVAGPVSRVEVLGVAGDRARLRLGLRSAPPDAAAELAQGGLDLVPGLLDPRTGDARAGEGWRLSLAGGR